MDMQRRNRLTDTEKNLWLPKGRVKGEVQIRGMGLTDINYNA